MVKIPSSRSPEFYSSQGKSLEGTPPPFELKSKGPYKPRQPTDYPEGDARAAMQKLIELEAKAQSIAKGPQPPPSDVLISFGNDLDSLYDLMKKAKGSAKNFDLAKFPAQQGEFGKAFTDFENAVKTFNARTDSDPMAFRNLAISLSMAKDEGLNF